MGRSFNPALGGAPPAGLGWISPSGSKSEVQQPKIADRVHSQLFGVVKVSFYHYFAAKEIVCIARRDGVAKQRIFTPELARSRCVVFNIASAIDWVRAVGFQTAEIVDIAGGHSALSVVSPPKPSEAQAPPPPAQTPIKPPPSPEILKPQAPKSTPPKPYVSDAIGMVPTKQRPMQGRITFMGEKAFPSRDGRPGFKSFAITLCTEYGGYERDFLGDHLSELAVEYALKVGDLVVITLLGKFEFVVEFEGKQQTRHRNQYEVTKIKG